MKNILIIGNGFDLEHGLPTKYTDFLKFIRAIRYKILRGEVKSDVTAWDDLNLDIKSTIRSYLEGSSFLEQIYKNLIQYNVWIDYFLLNPIYQKENWIDFESEIRRVIQDIDSDMKNRDAIESTIIEKISVKFFNKYFFKYLTFQKNQRYEEMSRVAIQRELCQNEYPEFIECYTKEHPAINTLKKKATYGDLIMRLESDLNKLICALEIYLDRFLSKIEVIKVSKDIKELNIDHVLSFNYSNTFEKLYGQGRDIEYDYIHGKANIDNTIVTNNMVLGIDEYLDDDRKNIDLDFIAFKKFYQRIHKQTGCKYKGWLNQISEEYNKYQRDRNEVGIKILKSKEDKSFDIDPFLKNKYAERINKECPQNNLYIFGHSLDVTDKDILRDLILHDNVHTTIFYHEENKDNGRTDLGKKIVNLVKVIGQDELIKRTGGSTKAIEFKLQQDMVDMVDLEDNTTKAI